jgi:hypothetical protein
LRAKDAGSGDGDLIHLLLSLSVAEG